MRRKIPAWLRTPAWTALWLVLLEATTRAVWQPGVIGEAMYRRVSPSFGYGYDFHRPLCEPRGEELVCIPTQYRPHAPQTLAANKTPDTFRIVTVGGSHAAGHRTMPYTPLALVDLRERCPERHWEAANFGVPGYGSSRILLVGREALELAPDLLVIDFDGSNEYEDSRDLAYREQLHQGIWGALFRSHVVVLGRKFFSAEFSKPAKLHKAPRREEVTLTNEPEVRQRWNADVAANYEELIRLAGERGTQVMFVGLGMRNRRRNAAYEERHQLMLSLAAKHGVHVVDMAKVFQELPAKERIRLFRRDKHHYNIRGHRLVAGEVADAVLELAGEDCGTAM